MEHNPFTPTYDDLPEVIPVFPLEGALLMPGTQLPLNIFEPRYLTMVSDALKSDRMIGMIQPDSGERSLHPVGCAGRITSFVETNDGRYHLILSGVCRFALGIEVATEGGYRRFGVSFEDFACDYAPLNYDADVNRPKIMGLLRQYTESNHLNVDFDNLDEAPDEMLVNGLITSMPFEHHDAQSLIETPALAERGRLLAGLMTVVADANTAPSGTSLN